MVRLEVAERQEELVAGVEELTAGGEDLAAVAGGAVSARPARAAGSVGAGRSLQPELGWSEGL